MSRIDATVELPTKVAYLKPTLHKRIRMIAAEQDRRINEVLEEALIAGLETVLPKAKNDSPSAN